LPSTKDVINGAKGSKPDSQGHWEENALELYDKLPLTLESKLELMGEAFRMAAASNTNVEDVKHITCTFTTDFTKNKETKLNLNIVEGFGDSLADLRESKKENRHDPIKKSIESWKLPFCLNLPDVDVEMDFQEENYCVVWKAKVMLVDVATDVTEIWILSKIQIDAISIINKQHGTNSEKMIKMHTKLVSLSNEQNIQKSILDRNDMNHQVKRHKLFPFEEQLQEVELLPNFLTNYMKAHAKRLYLQKEVEMLEQDEQNKKKEFLAYVTEMEIDQLQQILRKIQDPLTNNEYRFLKNSG
jgi:hypothetical protein